MRRVLLFILTILVFINASAATLNVIIITDPTGTDPNGAAAGSMSYAPNMFQSTFISSKENHFAVLSGGLGSEGYRLSALVDALKLLQSGSTPATAASAASNYGQSRLIVGGPKIGAAVGGSFDVYVVTVDDTGKITATPYGAGAGGLAVLPAGQRGAIIHLRNTEGNPQYGTATAVRQQTAINIGKMIRDGYPATEIMSKTFEEVSKDAGEKHGGGAVNLVSGVTTGDMFTPLKINTTGFPMDSAYSKVCPNDGWSIAYPAAESYTTCPIDGAPLQDKYAYEVLGDAITVTGQTVDVSVYGTDAPGVAETTDEIVKSGVKKKGYSSTEIANSLNSAINDGLLVGVNHVEPKDINVKEASKAVGVYYTSLPDHRTSPPWNLPVSSSILNLIGSMQTAIGLILVILVLFRSTLITSFLK